MERLLFVDDDIEILSLNRSYFTEHGYDVDTASSAEEAMELLKDRSYDCLVLDIKMEAQDGFELCKCGSVQESARIFPPHMNINILLPLLFLCIRKNSRLILAPSLLSLRQMNSRFYIF